MCIFAIVQEMYWYIAKDHKGRKGMVPGNFLRPLQGIYKHGIIIDMSDTVLVPGGVHLSYPEFHLREGLTLL